MKNLPTMTPDEIQEVVDGLNGLAYCEVKDGAIIFKVAGDTHRIQLAYGMISHKFLFQPFGDGYSHGKIWFDRCYVVEADNKIMFMSQGNITGEVYFT